MARRTGLNLSAPKVITFVIAVVLMAIGIVGYYTDVFDLKVDTAFMVLTGGGVLLAISVLLKDL
ncbi:MAG: hypothetical protein WD184_04460 [Acidimicrobiia bacterium]